MSKKRPPRPTNAELAILRVLWEHGPCVVGEVHEQLNRQRPTGYTTVLKFLQIMFEKGLVVRNEKRRPYMYQARQTQEQTQKQLVEDLLERAFGGSAQKLLIQALSAKKASPEELREIRQLLDDLQGEEQ